MTVTLIVPDELAQRLQAAAVARGVSVEQLAVEILSRVDAPAPDGEPETALESFLGTGAGNGARFDIHDARRDLAERRRAGGSRHL